MEKKKQKRAMTNRHFSARGGGDELEMQSHVRGHRGY